MHHQISASVSHSSSSCNIPWIFPPHWLLMRRGCTPTTHQACPIRSARCLPFCKSSNTAMRGMSGVFHVFQIMQETFVCLKILWIRFSVLMATGTLNRVWASCEKKKQHRMRSKTKKNQHLRGFFVCSEFIKWLEMKNKSTDRSSFLSFSCNMSKLWFDLFPALLGSCLGMTDIKFTAIFHQGHEGLSRTLK